MKEPIKVGDKVRVVKVSCNLSDNAPIGEYTVKFIAPKVRVTKGTGAYFVGLTPGNFTANLKDCRKIKGT